MIQWIDNAILTPVTKLAHWLQRRTKRACYWWAAQAALAAGVTGAGSVALSGSLWWAVLPLICWSLVAKMAMWAEERFWNNPTVLATFDSVSRFPQVWRVGFFCVIGLVEVASFKLELHYVLSLGNYIAQIAYWYFMAVVPLPPGMQMDRARGTLIPVVVREGV